MIVEGPTAVYNYILNQFVTDETDVKSVYFKQTSSHWIRSIFAPTQLKRLHNVHDVTHVIVNISKSRLARFRSVAPSSNADPSVRL